ncbi:MAG: hypothetical protein MUE85_17140 [Microscillaceae bacterium]|jgi:hypothetical protein|nr:hypothetical protein [Microscillaceae bacterium]
MYSFIQKQTLTILILISLISSTYAQTENVLASQAVKFMLSSPLGSLEQHFEVSPNYLGEAQLFSNLLLNLNNQAEKVIISQSIDGKNWQIVNTTDLLSLNRSSLQNLPLQIGLADIESLLTQTTHKLFIKVSVQARGNVYEFPQVAELSKHDLKKLRRFAESQVIALN